MSFTIQNKSSEIKGEELMGYSKTALSL